MSKQDDYLQSQLPQILQPGEQVLHAAYMRRQPGLLMQILLVGGLLLFLMTKAYYAVLTNRRLILIRCKMSFWTGGPSLDNLGVEQYDASQIKNVTVSGFANNRSMTFHMADGTKQTLRISPWFKQIAGTKAFFEQVPGLVTSGQLAQLAGQAAPGQLPRARTASRPSTQRSTGSSRLGTVSRSRRTPTARRSRRGTASRSRRGTASRNRRGTASRSRRGTASRSRPWRRTSSRRRCSRPAMGSPWRRPAVGSPRAPASR
jgi:hypothetical protein